MDRRDFLDFFPKAAAGAALFLPGALERVQAAAASSSALTPDEAATNEDFWFEVRHAFSIDRNIMNLNNGSVCPAPKVVQDAEKRFLEIMHMQPSHYVDTLFAGHSESVRQGLARNLGCSPDEVAITRNTTESLNNVIFGLNLKDGDEILTTNQDYPTMVNGFKQRALRDGVVLKQFSYPTPPPDPHVLTELFEQNITPRTRVILVSHVTFTTGQVFPVQEICTMARERGIFSIVDGAHSFAHLPFRIDEMQCDAYGSSLHKWLSAPIGTGLLYVRQERIAELWPLMATGDPTSDNIRKFEGIGTNPVSIRDAITEAVTFHESIGIDRKAARLAYLRKRWQGRLAEHPKVKILSGDGYEQAIAIGAMAIEGMDSGKLMETLLAEDRIHVRPRFVGDEFHCIRVSPNVYTTIEEVDRFSTAIERIASA